MWGLDTDSFAPCFWQTHNFPTSCECLVQCEAAGHAAIIDCVQSEPFLTLPTGLKINLTELKPPWQGGPKELRGPWPELRVRYDPSLYARLQAAGRASRAAGLCSGRGIAASIVGGDTELRKSLTHKEAKHMAACACAPGFGGVDACEPLPWHASNCINSCSGAGECVGGTCVCHEHRVGIDCSVDRVDARHSFTAARSSAAAEARIGAATPRIYVYELPPRFNTWLALPRLHADGCGRSSSSSKGRSSPCWWQVTDNMYSADTRLLSRLMASPHRTLQPEKADFFYVPLSMMEPLHIHIHTAHIHTYAYRSVCYCSL